MGNRNEYEPPQAWRRATGATGKNLLAEPGGPKPPPTRGEIVTAEPVSRPPRPTGLHSREAADVRPSAQEPRVPTNEAEDLSIEPKLDAPREILQRAQELAHELTRFAAQYESHQRVELTAVDSVSRRVAGILQSVEDERTVQSAAGDLEALDRILPEIAIEIAETRTELDHLWAHVAQNAPVQYSWLEMLGQSAIRIAASTLIGTLIGGPAIALVLGEPLASKTIEGAIGGFIGGVGNEAGIRLTAPSRDLDNQVKPRRTVQDLVNERKRQAEIVRRLHERS